MVISTAPAISGCAGQGVPINRLITATFDQAMDSSTINLMTFTVTGPGTTSIGGSVAYDATNHIAIFTPTGTLPPGTTITATITTGALSAAEVPLASDYVWTFVTGAASDTVRPTVVSTDPADTATGVPTNQKVTATFSQAMDPTTITGSSFKLTGPGAMQVGGTVTYSTIGTTATFTPDITLTPSVVYTATITTAVQDLAGNSLAANYQWTFTAGGGPDSTAPVITMTTPADGSSGVALNAGINATFSKPMDPATLNAATFYVTGPSPTPLDGKITYDVASQIVTFTPASPLATTMVYTATITTGATDLAGNPLAADFLWTLTAGSSSSLAPVDLGAASSFGVFAEAAVTNTGPTLINGDLGLTPGTSITGFLPGMVTGTIEINTPAAVAALASLGTAYGDAMGRAGAAIVAENLAGLTLDPGLYTSAATSFEITGGNLTLDAHGDPNAVWIFQMPSSTLTLTTPTCNVILANGAQFSNVFWQVGSSATIGTGCAMEGNILADTSITLDSGATLHGRALAGAITSSGAVTLDTNSVSAAGACVQ
jgi:Ice-binding-like/Bacterial Ig-like domain